MTKTTFIYALCDPDTNEVRYIGKADNPSKRLKRHLANYEPNPTHKTNWIQSLIKASKEPSLVILEVVLQDDWQAAEKKWIEYYKSQGANLTNTAEGGLGGDTGGMAVFSDEERTNRSKRAKRRMSALWTEIKKEREAERAIMREFSSKEATE